MMSPSSVGGPTVSEYVARLTEAERQVDAQIEDHVANHHQDLLDQGDGHRTHMEYRTILEKFHGSACTYTKAFIWKEK